MTKYVTMECVHGWLFLKLLVKIDYLSIYNVEERVFMGEPHSNYNFIKHLLLKTWKLKSLLAKLCNGLSKNPLTKCFFIHLILHQGYYKRTPDYIPILQGTLMGCTPVPVVHSALLIDLRWSGSELLQHWPALDGFTGPLDEVTLLAHSAKVAGNRLSLYITTVFFLSLFVTGSGKRSQLAHMINL